MSFLFPKKNSEQPSQPEVVEIDEQELADVNGGHHDGYGYGDDHDHDDDDYYYDHEHHRHHRHHHHHH